MNQNIFNFFFSLSDYAIIKNASIFFSNYLIYILFVTIFIFVILQKKSIFSNLFLVGLAGAGSWVVSKILKSIFHISRPFVALDFTPIVPETGFSFPSSHATVFAALTIVAFHLNKTFGIMFGTLSILIGFSRIVLGVHYPLDILGGFLVGSIFAYFCVKFVKKYT